MHPSGAATTDLVLVWLRSEGPLTLSQLLVTLPELAAGPHGLEALRLLLRLDRRLRLLEDGRWALAGATQTPEQRIVASARAYLDALPGGGAMLTSVVTHVVRETNYDQAAVRSVIQQRFVTLGKAVLNRLKET